MCSFAWPMLERIRGIWDVVICMPCVADDKRYMGCVHLHALCCRQEEVYGMCSFACPVLQTRRGIWDVVICMPYVADDKRYMGCAHLHALCCRQ